jgi:hypothetical protein
LAGFRHRGFFQMGLVGIARDPVPNAGAVSIGKL